MGVRDYQMLLPPMGLSLAGTRFVPDLPPENSDEPIGQSYLGTPILSNLIFEADPDTPENEAFILNTVLMNVDTVKNVVRTPITGRNGSVKEYINRDDYEINISGLIVSEDGNTFPREQITAFRNLMDLPKSLAVSSEFLQIFSIHNLVIIRSNVGQIMGYRNQVQFMIQAISDVPIELKEF